MEGVCEPIVAEIMRDCTHTDRESVKLAQLRELHDIALRQEEVAHLKDVHGVHIVVVLDVSPVAFVHLANEARKLCLIHLR